MTQNWQVAKYVKCGSLERKIKFTHTRWGKLWQVYTLLNFKMLKFIYLFNKYIISFK